MISNNKITAHLKKYRNNNKMINEICTDTKENKSFPKNLRNNFSNYNKIKGLTNEEIKMHKYSLDSIKKYINNVYIYSIFYDWGFTLENRFIPFESNINSIEACFISLCVQAYLNKNIVPKSLSILEIGFAYGTSSIIFMDQLMKYHNKYKKNKIQYDIFDPCQTKVWKNIGTKNLIQFQKVMNCEDIPFTVHETVLQNVFAKKNNKNIIKSKYDIIFIDAAHSYDLVLQDIMNADKLLEKGGIMILDDVLHGSGLKIFKATNEQKKISGGVYWAVNDFLKNNKNYKKVIIEESINRKKPVFQFVRDKKLFYNKKFSTVFNPSTMFCLIKT